MRINNNKSVTLPRLSGNASGRLQSGFTLLELMIVILIIGILMTLAVITLPETTAKERAETESKRLSHLIQLVSENATIKAKVLGVLIAEKEYAFFFYDKENKAWTQLSDRLYRRRVLPEGMKLTLTTEEGSFETPNSEDRIPQLLLAANGEMTPLRIRIVTRDQKAYYEIRTSIIGRVQLKPLESTDNADE